MGIETALGLLGGIMGGVGGVASAMGSPGMPAQIDPAIAAELSARGIDIQEYQMNMQAAQLGMTLPFSQDLQQYPLEANRMLQDAYTQGFGGTFTSLQEAMEGAAAGKETTYTRNLLAKMEQDIGQRGVRDAEAAMQRMSQAGISPDSPMYQEVMANLDKAKSEQLLTADREVRLQQGKEGMEQAQNFLRWGASAPRLPGGQTPDTPQTAEQRSQGARAEVDKWYEEQKKNTNPWMPGAMLNLQKEYQNRLKDLPQAPSQYGTGMDLAGGVTHPPEREVRNWFETTPEEEGGNRTPLGGNMMPGGHRQSWYEDRGYKFDQQGNVLETPGRAGTG